MKHFLLSKLGNWKIQVDCNDSVRILGNDHEMVLLDEDHDKIGHFSIDQKGSIIIHDIPYGGQVKVKEGYQTIVVYIPYEEESEDE